MFEKSIFFSFVFLKRKMYFFQLEKQHIKCSFNFILFLMRRNSSICVSPQGPRWSPKKKILRKKKNIYIYILNFIPKFFYFSSFDPAIFFFQFSPPQISNPNSAPVHTDNVIHYLYSISGIK